MTISKDEMENLLSRLDQGAEYQGFPDGFWFSWTKLARDAAATLRAVTAQKEPVQPSDLAEDCAKIAEGHVGAVDTSPGTHGESYDEACRDIAKAIRDTYGVGE